MEYSFENWKAGKFYMNTCPKPVFRDNNEPEIEAVDEKELHVDVAQKIREEQETIMEEVIKKFLEFSQNDFKKLYGNSREKDKLVEDELINTRFIVFNENPHGFRGEEWVDGETLYRLKRVSLSFPPYYLRELRQHISRNYVRAHPDANPTPINCSFIHALSIKAKSSKYIHPVDNREAACRFHIWREADVNYDNPIAYGEAVYRFHNWIVKTYPNRSSGIFVGQGVDVFELYRTKVILSNLQNAHEHYSRLYSYFKTDGYLSKYITPTIFLNHLKSLEGEDIEMIDKCKQLKSSKYKLCSDKPEGSLQYRRIRDEVLNREV
jgi:hypothetical protein